MQKFLESRGYLEVSLQWTLLLHCKLIQLHSGHYLTIFHLSEHHYYHYYHQQYYLLHLQRGEGVIKDNLRRETNLSTKAKGYVPKDGCCSEVSLYMTCINAEAPPALTFEGGVWERGYIIYLSVFEYFAH